MNLKMTKGEVKEVNRKEKIFDLVVSVTKERDIRLRFRAMTNGEYSKWTNVFQSCDDLWM